MHLFKPSKYTFIKPVSGLWSGFKLNGAGKAA